MKKSVKKEEVKVEERKEKKPLKECMALWEKEGKLGTMYYTGSTPKDENGNPDMYLKAFINSKKENPKQPDIRVYTKGEDDKDVEVASLWDKVGKKGTRYLSGKTNENEYLIGFYNEDIDGNKPSIKVYYQENQNNDEELPF